MLSSDEVQSKTISKKKIEAQLLEESKYVKKLFSIIAFPERCDENGFAQGLDDGETKQPAMEKKTKRATSLTDLQNRLKDFKSKKLKYKEKLVKKGVKNRIKKKVKIDQRKANKNKGNTAKKEETEGISNTETTETKPSVKPLYNSDGKMVFSKFDFSGLGKDKKEKKKEKDPKKILENLKKQKEKLAQLEAQGETGKVKEIKEKNTWKNAIAKAQGEKVKDDPELLKKSLKREELKKKKSKKKWDQRIEGVKQAKDERQKKRQENIDKRKKEVKTKKLKRAAKKGKIIPGF